MGKAGKAETPAAKKRKAVDAAHQEDSSVTKGPRTRPDRTIEGEVKQAMYDNVRLYTKNMLDCIIVDGQQRKENSRRMNLGKGETGRERITKEKIQCREEGRKTGSLFWKKFRADYGCVASNSKNPALKIAMETVMPEPLWGAFKSCIYQDKRDAFTSQVNAMMSLDETSAKILAKSLFEMSPKKSTAMYHTGMAVIACFSRCDAATTHSDVFEAVRLQVDGWLVEAPREGKLPETPASLKLDEVKLILPLPEVDQILALPAESSLLDVATQLRFVSKGTLLGEALFSSAVKKLASLQFDTMVATHLKRVDRVRTAMTKASYASTLAEMQKAARELDNVDVLKGRHQVNFKYRGLKLQMHMTSLDKRCELALQCRLREQACIGGLVKLLPGEPAVSSSTEKVSWVLTNGFVMPMIKARQHLLDALEESKSSETQEQHGEDVFAVMRLHTKHLHQLDPFWHLDVEVLTALTNHDQSSAILDAWFDAVFAKSTVREAVEESSRMKNSPSSAWALVGTKSEMQQGHDFLQKLMASETVAGNETYTPWVTKVLAKIVEKWLVEVKSSPDEAASSKEAPLIGQPVLEKLYNGYMQTGKAPTKLDELVVLKTWKHLLTDEQETQLIRWRDDILTSTEGAVGSMKASAKGKAAVVKKSKGATDKDYDDAARALFC
eukprot:6478156-Amphidinium_carterae.2